MSRWLLLALFTLPAIALTDSETVAVVAHPPFATYYTCSEHSANLDLGPGDALGSDCVVQEFPEETDRYWLRSHVGDGTRNEDWYGWRERVLSPCDCIVSDVHVNKITNTPGKMTPGRASSVQLRREDGVNFVIAHVREIDVAVGDSVQYGQPLARVGNNGYSRHPHIHLGAWKEDEPLQVRFDLRHKAVH